MYIRIKKKQRKQFSKSCQASGMEHDKVNHIRVKAWWGNTKQKTFHNLEHWWFGRVKQGAFTQTETLPECIVYFWYVARFNSPGKDHQFVSSHPSICHLLLPSESQPVTKNHSINPINTCIFIYFIGALRQHHGGRKPVIALRKAITICRLLRDFPHTSGVE